MKNLDPPSPPNQGWENGAFLPFARLHPWFGGDGGLLFHFILSKIAILDKINGKPRPPLRPQIKDGKNGAFLPFARLHPWFGGDGGLLFHFILSKIVSCQSCLVPQLVPRPHYYSAQPERLGSRGPNEDPGKTPYTWYKPRSSEHGGEVGGWKRFRIFYRGFCTDSSLSFKRETHN